MVMTGLGHLSEGTSHSSTDPGQPPGERDLRMALAGGGPACFDFLNKITASPALNQIVILGVADPDSEAPGLTLARNLGLPVFSDFLDLYKLEKLDTVIDFTGSDEIGQVLISAKPSQVSFLDPRTLSWFLNRPGASDADRHRTDKKGSEQKLRKFQTILDSIPYRIMVVNLDYTIDMANRTYLLQHGRTLDQVKGQPCYFIRYGYDRPCHELGRHCFFEETVFQNACASTILEYENQNGLSRYDVITVAPIVDENGTVVQHLEASRDVTERISLEQDVRQSNTFLQKVIQSTVDGIVVVNTKGQVLLFNEGMARLTGYKVEEIMHKGHMSSFYDMDVARANMKKMRSADFGPPGKLNPTSMTITTKDHRQIPVTLSASLIEIDGKEIGSVGVFTDMREIEAMRRELDEAHLKLVQSDKIASLGRLAAGVAHEINNPLSIIMMYAEMLEQGLSTGAQAQSDIREIITQTLRCKNIVADLLEFSRRAGGLATPFRLDQLVERCLNLLKNLAIFHNIILVMETPKDLPLIKGDMGQLEQVITNLLTNAADAMNGKGRLSVKARYDTQRDMFILEVADSGPGIPLENRDKIFDIFFTTKPVGVGTGLGLSISKNIIESHGGTISFECPDTGGTIFTIELPRSMNDLPDNEPVFIGMEEL